MGDRQELRQVLLELQRDPARPLRGWPDPREENLDQAPVDIELAGDAAALAQALHERFGELVRLRVGFLPYPPGSATVPPPWRAPAEPLPADLAVVELAEPAVVPSGRTLVTRLVVLNRGGSELVLSTTGELRGDVVDPTSGDVVGGESGMQIQPHVAFRVPAEGSRTVPLRVGTESRVPRLGWTVPPGEWAIEVDLTVWRRGAFRTPRLPLRVTAADRPGRAAGRLARS